MDGNRIGPDSPIPTPASAPNLLHPHHPPAQHLLEQIGRVVMVFLRLAIIFLPAATYWPPATSPGAGL